MSSRNPVQKKVSAPVEKQVPGIGGINDGSGRNMTHEKRPDHDAVRIQQHPQTPRESKKE